MQLAGAIGVGLVIGWAAARLLLRAPWRVWVWLLLGLTAMTLLVFALASLAATIAFAVALLVGALAGWTWVRSLEARYGRLR